MDAFHISILSLSGLAILTTIIPWFKWDYWLVRIFDFPRLQIATLQLVLLVAMAFYFDAIFEWWYLIAILLLICFLYQLKKIFRYTPFAAVEVKKYHGSEDENCLALVVSNVLDSNRNAQPLLDLVRREEPDLLLTLESNLWWEDHLKSLEEDYPSTVKIPLDNKYGMHLYSKLGLKKTDVKYLFSDEVPSIHAEIELRSGRVVHIHCLHPKPPSPTESGSSTNRDAELLIVAKEVDIKSRSELVFGDLNDVAWSRTTRMFQKVSGLLDPRIGRGFYNTFNAKYPLFRWPLDHIFHTNDFTLIAIHRLEDIGSDHFPILVKLHYNPKAEEHQEKPDTGKQEQKEANEKIEEAK